MEHMKNAIVDNRNIGDNRDTRDMTWFTSRYMGEIKFIKRDLTNKIMFMWNCLISSDNGGLRYLLINYIWQEKKMNETRIMLLPTNENDKNNFRF